MSECIKIRYIDRLTQMVGFWRRRAAATARSLPPSDVATGYVAVAVGSNAKRFVVRVSHLNHPLFKNLLLEAEEEHGFTNSGPLAIPCDETLFEEIIRFVGRSGNCNSTSRFMNFQRCCHLGIRSYLESLAVESRPLLNGISDDSFW